MGTSYKRLYEEAVKENERLAAENMDLRAEVWRRREVVDLAGIARHMKVERYTPQQWQQRDHLPPVDFPLIKGVPLWYAQSIIDHFATPTRRVWYENPEESVSPAA